MPSPYHIGNGWFGGMLPLLAAALMAASGNIYRGLALIGCMVGPICLEYFHAPPRVGVLSP